MTNQLSDHGLTERQVGLLKAILQPYASKIQRADLFGSRATGQYRPSSDIDLVLYGDISQAEVDRLWTLFEDSSLPYKVDVHAYNAIDYPPFREHIDRVGQTLFTQADLSAA